MFKRKLEGFKKALTLGLLGLITASTVIGETNITSSAHNAYFLSITIDESTFKYVPTVIYEENSFIANNHRESELGNFTEKTVDKSGRVQDFLIPKITYEGSNKMEDADIEKEYKKVIEDGDGDKGLAFSFPGLHSRGFVVDRRHANAIDEERANFIAENLVGGLNDALSFIINKSGGKDKYSASELKNFSVDLAQKSYLTLKGSSQNIKLGNATFNITKANSSQVTPLKGTTMDDYITISTNGDSISVLGKTNKGYQDRSDISNDYKENLKKYKDPNELNWKFIVLQGNYNADVKKITFSSINEIVKPSAFSLAVGEFFAGLLNGLRNLLGLYPLEDVMLNGGARNGLYYYGLMPKGWMNSASLLHVICQILAWSILGFSLVRMLHKRQLSTMNIGERVSLMEGFKDLVLTAFLLGMFVIIFNFMVRLNYSLVNIFAKSSAFSSYIGTTTSMSTGVFASIVINFAFFIISAYFNFTYVLRAFTVAILFGVAPLAIVSISFGGRFKQIFSNFSKELVANIFLQTFHAMCVAFFTSVTSSNQMRTFELLVVLFAFIPITNFIRQAILGLPGGITDQASGLANMGRAVIGGTVGGLVGGSLSKKGGSGSGSLGTSVANSPVNANISRALQNKAPIKSGNSISKKFGGEIVDNEELFGGMNNDINEVNTANASRLVATNKSNSALKGALKGVGQVGMGVASMGTAFGFGAIGDKRSMESSVKSGKDFFQGAVGSVSNILAEDFKSSGIKSLYNGGEHMTAIYNTDEFGNFKDSALNQTDYARNTKEMYEAFTGTGAYDIDGEKADYRDKAVNHYKSYGIEGVGLYGKGNNKNLAIKFNKDMAQKKNFSFRDVSNITPYDPSKDKSNFK